MPTIGVLGGGQLARMMMEAAHRLNVKLIVLDSPDSPAMQLCPSSGHVVGSFKNAQDIEQLASLVDLITVEIEHVDVDALESASKKFKIPVQPSPVTLRIIQDKYKQKVFLSKQGLPIPEFQQVDPTNPVGSIQQAIQVFGLPVMLKSKTLAYDGRGNKAIYSVEDIQDCLDALGGGPSKNGPPLYIEKWAKFKKELAVMVAKDIYGNISSYPCVETIQRNHMCHLVLAPAQIDGILARKARNMAESSIQHFDGAGIFGVELFLLEDDTLLINEIAPRPHNSGHYTIEACFTSQFEQHLKSILGYPLGNPELKVNASIMLNIIGGNSDQETQEICKKSPAVPNCTLHWYGKTHRVGRKMGHVTLVGESLSLLQESLSTLLPDSHLSLAMSPLVGIIMGSDSDLPVLKPAAQILNDFNVPFEISIVSAHRTPERMVDYAKTAHERGLKVLIAAAGGAAHLPGMVAAITPLPVIGVPVALKVLDGMDSLYSIVQMPRGVPVATVAINNSTNAALLAIRILSVSYSHLIQKMKEFQDQQKEIVLEKVSQLNKIGWENY